MNKKIPKEKLKLELNMMCFKPTDQVYLIFRFDL